ncbi:MAG: PHP domain-containing protein [Phycisphaeraceae bacterium]|nr:PHP domain-containing protein [Phycisphaeraceae bacterium]
MSVADMITRQAAGATFFRADLHIHSYGASHDVADQTMTPEAIVAMAAAENISVVAITDHNDISNVDRAVTAAESTDVLVIPGVELSTSQGHLLCYFSTPKELVRFFAQLNIADPGKNTSRCQQSILECLNQVENLGGFGILAHVDTPAGFEHEVPGASPHKVDVICHPGLLGIELKNAASDISFCPKDPNTDRTRMGNSRISRLSLGSKQFLARVLNSDAHALTALGRNAANAKRVTRYKMDAPNFAALKLALEDADARVRIEDQIPSSVPRVHGMALSGGFLNGQVIRFSPNLNCIIGGRGTGKSTTFEGIRCLIEHSGEPNKLVDSEVWPDQINILWQDKAGQQHSLMRHKNEEIKNLDDPDFGPCQFDIDCFGQGDAVKISQHAQTNPLVLLTYLDKFVDLKTPLKDEDIARDELLSLQTEIEKAGHNVELIPQYARQLEITTRQLAAMQQPEVKELIELQRQLATERTLRIDIATKLERLKTGDDESVYKTIPGEIVALADPAALKLGTAEYQAIVNETTALQSTVGEAQKKVMTGISELEKVIGTQVGSGKRKNRMHRTKSMRKRKSLRPLKSSSIWPLLPNSLRMKPLLGKTCVP